MLRTHLFSMFTASALGLLNREDTDNCTLTTCITANILDLILSTP